MTPAGDRIQRGGDSDVFLRHVTGTRAVFIKLPDERMEQALARALTQRHELHRGEHLVLGPTAPGRLQITGDFSERLGATSQIYAQTGNGEMLIIQVPGNHTVARGEPLVVSFDPVHAHLFDETGVAV